MYNTDCKGHICCCCNTLWHCDVYACQGGRAHCPGHEMTTNSIQEGATE